MFNSLGISGNRIALVMVGMLGAGCSGADTSQPSEAARELGIDRFETSETASHLVVTGLRADGLVVARAAVEQGWMTFEQEDMPPGYGRRMTVEVDGRTIEHESPGVAPLELPLQSQGPAVAAFLLDPIVESALATRGIGFQAPEHAVDPGPRASDEAEYGYQCYHAGSSSGDLGSCTHSGCSTDCRKFEVGAAGGETGEFRDCWNNGNGVLIERRCMPMPGGGNKSTSCGTTGSLGCVVCWTSTYDPTWDYAYTYGASGWAYLDMCVWDGG